MHESGGSVKKRFFELFQQLCEIHTRNFTVTCLHCQLWPIRAVFLHTCYLLFFVLSLSNLFRPVCLPLNIKHCSGYVTVSFSVLFQINYASVWHRRFGAKTNSFLSFFFLGAQEETVVSVRPYWINCARAKGLCCEICSPGRSKFIQMQWHGAGLRIFNRLPGSNKAALIYLQKLEIIYVERKKEYSS